MVITVTLPANQNSPQSGGGGGLRSQRQFDVTLLSGSTLAELIPDLGVELPLEQTVLEVNGQITGLDTVLHDGDRVNLIPTVSAGPAWS
jgi:molybdopterin converting factor small subunit